MSRGERRAGPADLPATLRHPWPATGADPAAAPPAGHRFGADLQLGADLQFGAAVAELQERVAARLAADGGRYAGLPADGKRLRTQALVNEELDSWVAHRAQLGRPGLSEQDEDDLAAAVHAALGGLGPLEPLLLRTDVEDIYFTGTAPVVLRLADGRKSVAGRLAASDEQLCQLLRSLAAAGLEDSSGREFSLARPLLQLRMRSVGLLGARLSAAMDVTPHPAGTIRVHRHMETSLPQLAEMGMVEEALREFLTAVVLAGGRVVVSGAAGVGKTVLLRALCRAIPTDQMIVTVEDDRELGLHVVPQRDEHGQVVYEDDGRVRLLRPAALVRSYEARPANAEGRGQVSMGDLLLQSLRDSPDVIVVGETRGADVVHLLDAASNGVAGVMCTIHAGSARGVFDRIVQMVRAAQPPLPADFALRAATSLDVIVHVTRNRHHQRFVSEVVQVRSGPLGETGYPVTEQLFAPDPAGRAVPTGHKPTPELAERLVDAGFDLGWLAPGTDTWEPTRFSERWGA